MSSASACSRVRGKPSKIAPLLPAASSRSPIRALTIASLTSLPAAITAFASIPTGLPLATASRSMSPVDIWIIPRCACSRAAWVPLPAPGGPNRTMFMEERSLMRSQSAPAAGLELRLLDEVAVLVGDQMALDLRHRVHGDVDDDQQAGPAEVEGHARLAEEELGDQADQHQISRASDGQPGDQIVEISLGRLARADAGDEAAVALQILGGLLAVELHRRVEEAEEGDAEPIEAQVQRRTVLQESADGDQPVARIRV